MEAEGVAPEGPEEKGPNYRRHIVLFLLTTLTVFAAGATYEMPKGVEPSVINLIKHIHLGWPFAVPLLAILVTHEFGHYFAAKIHRVPASLPYFIPMPPGLSPFGTMGAVISMPSRIRSRNALLDIGAAGPIAGMIVAVPVLIYGLAESPVKAIESSGGYLEGQCLLYTALKLMVHGDIPIGHDVYLTSMAFAGWTGLLITMLNMLPVGQLDGGHIAYALFDEKQNRFGDVVQYGLLIAFGYNYAMYNDVTTGFIWVLWFGLLTLMRRAGGGVGHPPTDPGKLTAGRQIVAALCLLMFVALFMPTPMRLQTQFAVPQWGELSNFVASALHTTGGT